MDTRSLKRLEYHKILEQLAGCAGSILGRERALELQPVTEVDLILRWQAETTEARELMRLEPAAEIGGWNDIRSQLERAIRGAMLEPEELFYIGQTLTAFRRIRKFLVERTEQYPLLGELGAALTSFSELEKKINSAILAGGEISDNASSSLAQIRRRLVNAQLQIKQRLEHIIRSPNYQKYLQDPIVTMREGRYVVPVKVEYRSQIPGIVHDQSGSGATLFIEPMPVVEANNEIKRMQAAEKQEIINILTDLTAGVRLYGEEIRYSLEAIAQLDFIMAKARYSQRLDAWAPMVVEEPSVDIRRGRHPLLTGDVVPTTIHLGNEFDTLVITGPNTGGKTVTLKTVGLLVLMAQSGLHVPADAGTEIGIFGQVFADIGDEQSIEQSLSTFSSHMKNIVNITEEVSSNSLVLLDELGAGTDPTEGAALAQAVLEKLHNAGARTVATTHYGELKNFAYARERVENASVEFDVATLRPTYRLLIGKPGRSNAFEIAIRLGLSPELVDKAREFLTTEQIQVEELMNNLERLQQEAEQEREESRRLRQEAELIRVRYMEKEQEFLIKKDAVLEKAYEEARKVVKQSRMEAEELIKDLRAKISEDAAKIREGAIQNAREKLKTMQGKLQDKKPRPRIQDGDVPETVSPGEEVFLPNYNQKGIVVSPPAGNGEVQVQVGIIKINVQLHELRKVVSAKPGGGQSKVANLMANKARDINSKLDMRGMRVEEALMEIEKYLDDAYLAGLPKVYLVHGKGTGALRAAVHQELKGHHRVKSFRLGEHGEGGMGVTVVELI